MFLRRILYILHDRVFRDHAVTEKYVQVSDSQRRGLVYIVKKLYN